MTRARAHILIVDDDSDTREMTALALRKSGYDTSMAATCGQALRLCEAMTFAVMLCDLQLDDGSGLDLMRELAGKCDIKGIACTGHGSPEDVDRSLAAGFAVHLVKPVDLKELVATIERVIAGPTGVDRGSASVGAKDRARPEI